MTADRSGPSSWAPTGSTRLAAVIGDPVRHSLSPSLHNAAFAAAGLDWVYVALPVPAGRGAEAVEAMRVLGIDGLSVTMPHKEVVAAAVDRPSATVRALGACNCVWRDGDELVGESTDGDGLVRSLADDHGLPVPGRRVLVLGTGGAARSIIEAVGRHEPGGLVVASRDPERAAAAARLAPGARAGTAEDDAADADLIINATPVGMAGGPDPAGVPVPTGVLRPGQAVVDIVYQPRRTPLLAAAEAAGAVPIDGVGMLIHQAAIAFERWTGRPAPVEVMRAAGAGLGRTG
ncbi:MAG: shikimate dehydrogenase [Acidimicrobiales bacterium]